MSDCKHEALCKSCGNTGKDMFGESCVCPKGKLVLPPKAQQDLTKVITGDSSMPKHKSEPCNTESDTRIVARGYDCRDCGNDWWEERHDCYVCACCRKTHGKSESSKAPQCSCEECGTRSDEVARMRKAFERMVMAFTKMSFCYKCVTPNDEARNEIWAAMREFSETPSLSATKEEKEPCKPDEHWRLNYATPVEQRPCLKCGELEARKSPQSAEVKGEGKAPTETEGAQESQDEPHVHVWHSYEWERFERCLLCGLSQSAARMGRK